MKDLGALVLTWKLLRGPVAIDELRDFGQQRLLEGMVEEVGHQS